MVDDFGATLNPLLLAGQVHGGTAQGIGQALLERTIYDPASGQLISASLLDYALPRAADLPAITFETRNVRCLNNPLGVKGAGEAGAIGSCPAVMNAIVDALWRALRIDHLDMPATPERVGRTRFCPVAASSGKLRAGGDVRQARDRHVGQGHHH